MDKNGGMRSSIRPGASKIFSNAKAMSGLKDSFKQQSKIIKSRIQKKPMSAQNKFTDMKNKNMKRRSEEA
mgnify:CR=1 FL=1